MLKSAEDLRRKEEAGELRYLTRSYRAEYNHFWKDGRNRRIRVAEISQQLKQKVKEHCKGRVIVDKSKPDLPVKRKIKEQ